MAYKGPVCKGCGKYPVSHEKRGLCCACRDAKLCFDCDRPAVNNGDYCSTCGDKKEKATEKAKECRDAVMEVVRKFGCFLEEETVGVELDGVYGYATLPQKGDEDDDILDSEEVSVGREAV
jgi:hypothetical protein